MRLLAHVLALNPAVPAIVRARDEHCGLFHGGSDEPDTMEVRLLQG